MSRYGFLACLVLMTACASAGDSDPQVPVADAHPMADAPPPAVDAAVDMCPSGLTCETATMLGTVSGDTGNDKLSAMGYQSAWYRVRVTEDYGLGAPLHLSAKVTSPAGVDFDVAVYLNPDEDRVECSATAGTQTTNGSVKETRASWGDTFATPDDRDVSIEIRRLSGSCAPAQMWQLEIEGDW